MASHHARRTILNQQELRAGGKFVLYWMDATQRTRHNHALERAVDLANRSGVPVVVLFCLSTISELPDRQSSFASDGISDVAVDLQRRGIRFHVTDRSVHDAVPRLAGQATALIVDRGYLRHERTLRKDLAEVTDCRTEQVESNVVVPVDVASDRREYAARTIRPKIGRLLDEFLKPVRSVPVRLRTFEGHLPGGVEPDGTLISSLSGSRFPPVDGVRGGMRRAGELLRTFLSGPIDRYAEERNDPLAGATTELSPYLRFGQISPIDIILAARKGRPADHPGLLSLTEELVVRRELAVNYVTFEPGYDRYDALPEWARRTLDNHRDDPRPYLYSFEQLESSATHDPYWNAAMTEMRRTGRMRGYMRMYWGKKVLEWSPGPEVAFERLLALNNSWFLDGGDPNSWTNVAWIFGNHDRPWGERPVFGTVRYMNDRGLRRKFDIDTWARGWSDSDSSPGDD